MRRGDLIVLVIFIVLALAASYIYFLRPPAPADAQIVIQVEGEDKFFYPLYQEGRDEIIDIQGRQGITFVHLQEDRVRVVDSACPDKLCVQVGWTNSSARPIACLPNRVIVKIVGDVGDGDFDIR